MTSSGNSLRSHVYYQNINIYTADPGLFPDDVSYLSSVVHDVNHSSDLDLNEYICI